MTDEPRGVREEKEATREKQNRCSQMSQQEKGENGDTAEGVREAGGGQRGPEGADRGAEAAEAAAGLHAEPAPPHLHRARPERTHPGGRAQPLPPAHQGERAAAAEPHRLHVRGGADVTRRHHHHDRRRHRRHDSRHHHHHRRLRTAVARPRALLRAPMKHRLLTLKTFSKKTSPILVHTKLLKPRVRPANRQCDPPTPSKPKLLIGRYVTGLTTLSTLR